MNTHRDRDREREREREQKDRDHGCYGNKMLHSVWIQTWVFRTTRQKILKAKVGHFFVTPNINPSFLSDKCTLSYNFGDWPFPHIFVRIKDVLYEFVFILLEYLLPLRCDFNKYKVRYTYYYRELWMCYKLNLLKFMFKCASYISFYRLYSFTEHFYCSGHRGGPTNFNGNVVLVEGGSKINAATNLWELLP
jgi:hypothetical protein